MNETPCIIDIVAISRKLILENEKVSTIFHSHIESYEHLNYGHIESEMDFQFPQHKRDPWNL